VLHINSVDAAFCYRQSGVVSLCLDTTISPAKTAETTEMLYVGFIIESKEPRVDLGCTLVPRGGMIRVRWKCGRISNYDINYEDLFVFDADIMPERQVLAGLLCRPNVNRVCYHLRVVFGSIIVCKVITLCASVHRQKHSREMIFRTKSNFLFIGYNIIVVR